MKEIKMSVIAVIKEKETISIAADSSIVQEDVQIKNGNKNKNCKLSKINDLIIGSVGSTETHAMFCLFASTHLPPNATEDGMTEYLCNYYDWLYKKTNKRDVDNVFIIIYKRKIFEIYDFYVREIQTYAAIGIGRNFVLGALYCKQPLQLSMEAACEFSIWCEKPIEIHTQYINSMIDSKGD